MTFFTIKWLSLFSRAPSLSRSCSRYLFTTANSPESTRRVYRLDVYGSNDSLLPRIWAVDAVGIGATSSELRTPCSATEARNAVQSQRSVVVTPHMSGCILPFDIGLPSYVSYGPCETNNNKNVLFCSERESAFPMLVPRDCLCK